ncbi:hypothetical protein O181_018046 [Austropuccinia psidii MF-1]|uniref:Uncharacterized protein n=1 Tax=Austropuccinia psidii MF-1 TaxID=1389203 RepID=A0A9Q3GSJ7_9BASI|nr:hypothetical protein [Austropuccinia psidii MF-1]
MVNDRTLGESILILPFTFQLNRHLKMEYWTDMDQALQLHQFPKYLFKWRMENKRFNLASHWEELWESFQKICLKVRPFKNLIEITEGWNHNQQLTLLEERTSKIRENHATIKAIEKK